MRTCERRSASAQLVEQARAGGSECVAALRGAGGGVVPFGRDEALLLERAQEPVEVAHLDARLARQLRQPLEQVVAVRRMLAQEQQQRRLGEPLDAGEDAPAAVVMPAREPRPSHPRSSPLHVKHTCKTH